MRRKQERNLRDLKLAPLALCVALLCLYAAVVQGSAQASGSPEACPPTAPTSPASVPPTTPSGGQPAPTQILVCVGSQSITGATFAHWAEVAKDSEGPAPTHPLTPSEVVKEIMGFLISNDWLLDEAKVLHIQPSAHEVRRMYNRIRKRQFHKQREFEAFLRRSGETVSDLLLRVKVNLVSARIQKRLVAGHRSEASKQRVLSSFVKEFKRRWQAQTTCVPEYAVADCGHVQNPPL